MTWSSLLLLAGVLVLVPTAYAGKIGAPYAPTRLAAVKKAFDFIDLGEDDTLVDLGAGDGKIVLEAARRGAQATGYELSPIMWLIAWLRILLRQGFGGQALRQGHAKIHFGNFYRKPLKDATVIFAFLMPANMPRVLEYLRKQSSRAKFVLVYAFPFPDAQPLTIIHEPKCSALYVYDAQELTGKEQH